MKRTQTSTCYEPSLRYSLKEKTLSTTLENLKEILLSLSIFFSPALSSLERTNDWHGEALPVCTV